jgi:hypothetical protein
VPHRATSATLLAAFLAAALSLLPACSSSGSGDPNAPPDAPDLSALPEGGIQAGWMSFKSATRDKQVTSLTLVSASSREGKLISAGRAQMAGGKVISDEDAASLLLSFERQGFDRYALRSNPNEAPQAAMGAIWINRGNGVETIFLMPNALANPETEGLPKVYEGLKALILYVHQTTPGSVATSGQGVAGDDLVNQKPGKKAR